MNIGFLHLSDMHIRDDNDISQTHLTKILDSFNIYKKEQINELVIIISGDITFSGETKEFDCAYNVIENLIDQLKRKLRIANCNLIIVPGNHDVCHNDNILSVDCLKKKKYNMAEEDKKLHNFYNFCKRFDQPDFKVYSCCETIDIQGFELNVNMINNAIFSTIDEYKGLLYIDAANENEMEASSQKGFTITVMHHSPDYYRDEIKNSFERKIIANSSIVFFGHEHNNTYKLSAIDGNSSTIIQAGGSLINYGSWENSSYCIGVLNSNELKYSYNRFTWNKDSKQYEREKEMANTMNKNVDIEFSEDFKELLDKMDKNYYVFPSLLCKKANEKKSLKIREYDPLIHEIEENVGIIISGSSNSGKTALMHRLFSTLLEKDYMVLFCSAEIIVSASNNKKQNPQKLIDFVFNYNYGANKSLKQKFEQSDIHKCIFMFDDFDQVKDINLSSFIDQLKIYFGKIILSTNKSLDFDFRNISLDFLEEITKLEIEPLVGSKRKELIRQIVLGQHRTIS